MTNIKICEEAYEKLIEMKRKLGSEKGKSSFSEVILRLCVQKPLRRT